MLSTAGLAQLWIDVMGAAIVDVKAYPMGWRDFDGDGDLDLGVAMLSSGSAMLSVWFENVARPAAPLLVGDVNRDGRVNGADLGILLSNWTP